MGLLLWRCVTLLQARSCPMWALAASLDIDSAKGQLIGILGARQISRYFPAIPTRQSYLWFRSVFRPNIICAFRLKKIGITRSEEHTSELQSHSDLVCRLLLEKKKN